MIVKKGIHLAIAGLLGSPFLPSLALAQEADSIEVYAGSLETAPSRKVGREWLIDLPEVDLCPPYEKDVKSYAVEIPQNTTGITIVVEPGSFSQLKDVEAETSGGADLMRNRWHIGDGPFDKRDVLVVEGLEIGRGSIQLGYASPFGGAAYELHVARASGRASETSIKCLTLSGAELSPPFHPGRSSYAAAVGPKDTELTLAPVAAAGTRVELAGTDSEGRPLAVEGMVLSKLTPGRNHVQVTTTAEDGTPDNEYSIEITRAVPSSDAVLESMTVGVPGIGGRVYEMVPAFNLRSTSYAVTVPNELEDVAIKTKASYDSTVSFSAVTEDGIELPAAPSLTMVGMVINGQRLPDTANGIVRNLAVGKNVVTVRVTAQDGVTERVYVATVKREP